MPEPSATVADTPTTDTTSTPITPQNHALAVPRGHLAIDPDQTMLTPEQKAAFRALGVDPDDPIARAHVRRFLHVCQLWGVDPWSGEIHLVQRGKLFTNRDGQDVDNRSWTIQTGIDGYRRRARELSADPACPVRWIGKAKWYWSAGGPPGDERSWRPVEDPDTGDVVMQPVWWAAWPDDWPHPKMAKAVITVEDKATGERRIEEFVAHWSMFAAYEAVWEGRQKKIDPNTGEPMMKLGAFWAKGPAHMLGKAAEANLLRAVFHGYFHGVYTTEEMARADAEAAAADAETLAQMRREAYQAAQTTGRPAVVQGAVEPRPESEPVPAAEVVSEVAQTLTAPQGDVENTGGTTAPDGDADAPASATQPSTPTPGPPADQPAHQAAETVDPIDDATRRAYLMGEIDFITEVIGTRFGDIIAHRAGRNIGDIPTGELQVFVGSYRPYLANTLRQQGRGDEAAVYETWDRTVAGPVDFLLGRTDTPDAASVGPHPFAPREDDDSRCEDCGGFEDDPCHDGDGTVTLTAE